MNINEVIHLKGIAEDNFNFKNEMIEFLGGDLLEKPFYALLSKTIEGQQSWEKQMMSEDDYCPECSRAGKRVTHKRNNCYYAFKEQNKKWLNHLNVLHQLIY